ncbi:sulfotransferase family protein [Microbulbifer hainanensis]|uniref:sulfotransferase family protein n=1 Tax=Microbulbifer hainanensis TaxID=2735675 RepID=UPI0018661C71|nr:sulfotransferase family protein [Microbulbifer hainanensis]
MEKIFPRKNEIEWFCHPSPKAQLIYWQNPKVACSSIKKSLWKFENGETPQNAHIRRESPFPFLSEMEDKIQEFKLFSIVRNPYSRALSAYLDKIGHGSDRHIWWPFCRDFKLARSTTKTQFTFLDFLKALNSTSASNLDPHFRPQFYNLLPTLIPYSFIGYLEEQEAIQNFLTSSSIPYVHSAPHSRNASAKVFDYYGEEEIELARKIFQYDFEFFGYSKELAKYNEPGSIKKLPSQLQSITFSDIYNSFPKFLENENIDPAATTYHHLRSLNTPKEKVSYLKSAIKNNTVSNNWALLREAVTILNAHSEYAVLKEFLNIAINSPPSS